MLRRELAPYAADRPFGPLTPADSLAVECRLSELLARLVRTQKLRRETPVPCWLARSRERLHAEAETPPSLTDLARQAGVHPSHLARAFRDHYGRTIGSYVRFERLRLACTRLTESGESLSDIAAQAGFADQAHFTRTFVARWGISPGRYRQCLRGAPALGIERMELGPKGIPRTEREPIDAGPGNFEPMQIPFKTRRD